MPRESENDWFLDSHSEYGIQQIQVDKALFCIFGLLFPNKSRGRFKNSLTGVTQLTVFLFFLGKFVYSDQTSKKSLMTHGKYTSIFVNFAICFVCRFMLHS